MSSETFRLRTPGGVPYKLLQQYGGFDREKASATVELLLPAAYLEAFVNECLPTPAYLFGRTVYIGGSRFPGMPILVASNVRWEAWDDSRPIDPFGTDPDAVTDTYGNLVKVTVDYEPLPRNEEEQEKEDPEDPTTYLEVSCSASGQYLHGEVRGVTRADNGEPVKQPDVPNMVMEHLLEWNVRWPQVPADFFNDTLLPRLRDKLGHVNSDVIKLFNNAPKHTLLFTSFDFQEQYTWQVGRGIDRPPITLAMRFVEKSFKDNKGNRVTHNHLWLPREGWTAVKIDGRDPYPETSFADLFRRLT